jgi:uncharacterized protein YecE (DUF72 family)
MSIHIGTSGWRYKEWGKKFYPKGIKQEEFLPFYASNFNTVEINATFYHLPNVATFRHWKEATPPDFVFAVKMSRFITHILRLELAKKPVTNFLKNAAELGDKMGPVLIQLPPSFKLNIPKLQKFFEVLQLAQKATTQKNIRFALEVRHTSWYAPEKQKELMELLKKYRIALVFGHSSKYPYPENEPVSADFIYLRFHGPKEFAGSLYGTKLKEWVPKIKKWSRDGIDVYAYFNNDQQAYAIRDVVALKHMLGSKGTIPHGKRPAKKISKPAPAVAKTTASRKRRSNAAAARSR